MFITNNKCVCPHLITLLQIIIQQNPLGVGVLFTKRVWDSPGIILVGITPGQISVCGSSKLKFCGTPSVCVCECNSSWTIPGNQTNYVFDIGSNGLRICTVALCVSACLVICYDFMTYCDSNCPRL